jgi:hypothetical protein
MDVIFKNSVPISQKVHYLHCEAGRLMLFTEVIPVSSVNHSKTINTPWKERQNYVILRPPLWSRGQTSWLQIQRSRVRFPMLPDFLRTGSTQPREYN